MPMHPNMSFQVIDVDTSQHGRSNNEQEPSHNPTSTPIMDSFYGKNQYFQYSQQQPPLGYNQHHQLAPPDQSIYADNGGGLRQNMNVGHKLCAHNPHSAQQGYQQLLVPTGNHQNPTQLGYYQQQQQPNHSWFDPNGNVGDNRDLYNHAQGAAHGSSQHFPHDFHQLHPPSDYLQQAQIPAPTRHLQYVGAAHLAYGSGQLVPNGNTQQSTYNQMHMEPVPNLWYQNRSGGCSPQFAQPNVDQPPIVDVSQHCCSNNEVPSQIQHAKQTNGLNKLPSIGTLFWGLQQNQQVRWIGQTGDQQRGSNGNNQPPQWVEDLVDHGIIPEQYQLGKLNQQRKTERQQADHDEFQQAQAHLLEENGQLQIPEGELMPLDFTRPDIGNEPIICFNNEIGMDIVQTQRKNKRQRSDSFESEPNEEKANKRSKLDTMKTPKKLEIGANGAIICTNVSTKTMTKKEKDKKNSKKCLAKKNQKLVGNEKECSKVKKEEKQVKARIDMETGLLRFFIALISSLGYMDVNDYLATIKLKLNNIANEVETFSRKKEFEKNGDAKYVNLREEHEMALNARDKAVSDWKNKEIEAELQKVKIITLGTRKNRMTKEFNTIDFEFCAENVKIKIEVHNEEQKLLDIQWDNAMFIQHLFFQNSTTLKRWAEERQKKRDFDALVEFLRIWKPK